jgi:four helix bundle protein
LTIGDWGFKEIFQPTIVNHPSGGWGLDPSDLKRRTKEFAHRCVKLALCLPRNVLGDHIRKQLIRCSTSVAANYRASLQSQSKAAFISKISIVIEEADESEFWLEFIIDEKLMEKEKVLPLYAEAHELSSIFITTRKTAQIGKR